MTISLLTLSGDLAGSTLAVNKYRTWVFQLTVQLSAERQVQMPKVLWRVGGQHEKTEIRVQCVFAVVRGENEEGKA